MTSRKIASKLEIKWDGSSWTDESANFKSATGNFALSGELPGNVGGGIAAEATFVLRNANNRYSPDNSSSAIYSYIQDGKAHHTAIRFSISVDSGSYTTLFIGYISDAVEKHVSREMTFRCLDYAALLQERRITTALYTDKRTDEYIYMLAISTEGGLSAENLSLERGIMTLPFVWADDESLWEEMVRATEVEGGRIYIRHSDGDLVLESGYHDVSNDTSVATYTTALFKEIEQGFIYDDIYNKVIVEYAPLEQGPRQIIYESDEIWMVPSSGSIAFDVRFNVPSASVYIPASNTARPDRGDWIAVTPGGQNINSDITVSINAGAQSGTVTIWNTSGSFDAYLPKFRIQGVPILGVPVRKKESSDSTSQSTYGRRDFQFPINPYIQRPSVAQYLADMTLDRLKNPRRAYILPIQGDTARVVGQRITVQEDASGVDRELFIRSIDWDYSGAGGFSMTLGLIDATIFTDTPYFIWDTTEWGGEGTGGRLWY